MVDGWVDSDGHCNNIMNPRFTDLGVGYYQGEDTMSNPWFSSAARLWTQNFGAPRGGGGACPPEWPWC